MPKHKKSKSTDIGILGPMIDLAGGIALGAITRHNIKKAYKEGNGPEAVRAATMAYGIGGMHSKDNHFLALGGLYGIQSGVRAAEKEKERARSQKYKAAYDNDIDVSPYTSNQNHYAWRMNCEDGSAYGISPMDYETRSEYHLAVQIAKEALKDENIQADGEKVHDGVDENTVFIFCRVSRLDNGVNEYYLAADDSLKIGSVVHIPSESGVVEGVVLSVEKHTIKTAPKSPRETAYIIGE